MPYLTKQLQLLWAPKTIHLLFMDMLEYSHARQESSPPPDTKKKSGNYCLGKREIGTPWLEIFDSDCSVVQRWRLPLSRWLFGWKAVTEPIWTGNGVTEVHSSSSPPLPFPALKRARYPFPAGWVSRESYEKSHARAVLIPWQPVSVVSGLTIQPQLLSQHHSQHSSGFHIHQYVCHPFPVLLPWLNYFFSSSSQEEARKESANS